LRTSGRLMSTVVTGPLRSISTLLVMMMLSLFRRLLIYRAQRNPM
jgi:hypothetical protein